MFLASAIGGGAAFAAVEATVGLQPTDVGHALAELAIGAVVGLFVLAAVATALRVAELQPVQRRLLRLLGRRPAGRAAPAAPAAMGGSAGSSSHSLPQPAPAQPRPADDPTIRKQVFERVTHPDADGRSGAPTAGPAGVPGTPDPFADDTTARPGGHADETLHIGPFVELAPGATVGGRYRLVSLVAGDDAGNRFWRAKDTVLPRDMAVTLLPEGNATAATVARTLRVGRLHHIGLPQTLDVGTEQGQSYVVGQWVDGATLTDLLAGGPLEPDVATSITAKVSEAVAEAHRNGIALGAINPSLVRVNFDGQVRLSHVIAHGSATPDQDIRAVGGLLYLMLTGMWPLPGASNTVDAGASGAAAPTAGIAQLTAAPTRLGREVPAAEVRPGVPTALSALAERALHPDDPAGIHAVSAIAALLRQPEAPTAAPAAEEEPARPVLNPGERRLVKERRVKLGIASVMIAAFSALIIIVVASLSKQVMDTVAGPTVTSVARLGAAPTSASTTAPPKTSAKPSTSAKPTTTGATSSSPTTSAAPAPVASVQQITDATVYDPLGDGVKDNTDQVPQAFDGNPQSFWPTFIYKLQFPSTTKPGVGLTVAFAAPITPTSVTITSDTPPTTIEVRAAAGPDLPYEQTTPLARGIIAGGTAGLPGSTTIPLANAPKSRYLVVFVVSLAPRGERWQSHLNEISVSGY